MSRHDLPFGRSHGVLLSRLVWPIGILFAATLTLVFSTILWTSDSVNEVASERQRTQMAAAIEQTIAATRNRLLDFATTLGVFDGLDGMAGSAVRFRSRFDENLIVLADLDSVALLTPDWRPLAGVFDGSPVATGAVLRLRNLAGGVVDAALAHPEGPGSFAVMRDAFTTRLLFDGSEIYAAFAVPVGMPVAAGQRERAVLVGVQYLSSGTLGKVASLHGLEAFRVSVTPPPDMASSLPVRDARGEIAAFMTWAPNRPGDLLRTRLIPLTLAGFCVAVLLFGLVAGYLQGLARDLARSEKQSRELIGRDPLSGLANRLFFGQQLDQELDRLARGARGLTVMFIDLDRFKNVNDTFGHQAGDHLIQLVAERLLQLLRTTDTIARFGGDEFAIIQTGVRSPLDAAGLARRILDSLGEPFTLAHSQVTIGASIGIALAPENADGRETLMRLADAALYQAKNDGRNRYSFFESRMDETIRMRKLVEDDLRRAIEEDGLVLHYQPLFSSDGVTVVGLEALVRWPHPTRGLISPGEFIAIAEEHGLVIPLGEWVLRRACLDGLRWPGLRVAINVSAIQFRHRDFVRSIKAMLLETGFEPSRLELELTEGVVVDDADAAQAAMVELRAMGVHLALDDFGTGYSSLIYLRRFAFDTIKIDRSFLESMDATGESAILVHSMVHLGRALGLTVTAEGVETREQHRFLQALGCHQLQGYLFSKPMPAAQVDELLGIGAEAEAA